MKQKRRANAIHPWSMWYWTTATEDLLTLDKMTLYTFRLLIDEAFKTLDWKD
jgi:hypothetical protein